MHTVVKEKLEQMRDKEFDESIKALKIQHKCAKEMIAKEKKFGDVVILMKDMKNKLDSLTSKNIENKLIKKDMTLRLCEQIAFCLLKDNKPKEAIKILTEVEVIQDTVKEKNLKAIMYMARAHLMMRNFRKAHSYFTTAYEIADENSKKEIKTVLEKIKKSIKEQDEVESEEENEKMNISQFKQSEIAHTSTALTVDDIQLIPFDAQQKNDDDDITMNVLEAQQEVSSICVPKKVFTDTIEICTIKPHTAILGEFLTKYANTTPFFDLDNTVQERCNKKIFTMTCNCLGHAENGSGSTKKKAKEMAAEKMITHFEKVGKLRLTTNTNTN